MTNQNKDQERDQDGRPPGAAGWTGDLTTASPKALDEHDKGMQRHIANLTVAYAGRWHDPAWRVATEAERREKGFDHWVDRLVEVRLEKEKRIAIVGEGGYSDLLIGPDRAKPWNAAAVKAEQASRGAGQ